MSRLDTVILAIGAAFWLLVLIVCVHFAIKFW